METTLDIFRNDAFSYTSLQRVVDNAPFVPTMLGQMQLFTPKPIDTEEVLLYEKDGGFALIPTTERGSPDTQQIRRQGRLRGLKTVRLSKKDTIRASELTGIASAAFPEAIRVRNAAQMVLDRTSQLKTDLEATKEFHRLGALQGLLLDADGTSVIENYFEAYGVPDPTVVEIDFATLTESEALMYFQETFFQPMVAVLKNRVTPNMRIGALCGDEFWGKLMRNAAFRKIYELMLQGRQIAMEQNPLARPNLWETVYFGGIYWTHFQGATNGEIAIEPDEATLFPIGAKDVFNVYWSPGETFFDATDLGKPEYMYLVEDPNKQMPSYIDPTIRAYPLYACIFPKALMRARVKP